MMKPYTVMYLLLKPCKELYYNIELSKDELVMLIRRTDQNKYEYEIYIDDTHLSIVKRTTIDYRHSHLNRPIKSKIIMLSLKNDNYNKVIDYFNKEKLFTKKEPKK